MTDNNTGTKDDLLKKIYGGLNMSWPAVIIMAVASAVVTAVFLQVPIFKNTSFERMGITFEAWFVFALLIMPNSKSPLDSALKTFVFFLVSQPLIYLIQVPFSDMGWGLLGYYRNWVVWTLLTFPMAFVGWFLRKRNWLSLLILSPTIVFLSAVGVGALTDTFYEPPHLLVTGLFCLGQVAAYTFAFTENKWQRLAALAAVIITAVIVVISVGQADISGQSALPDGYSYSENAEISVENSEIASVELTDPKEGFVYIKGSKYGETEFTVTDGDKKDTFTLKLFRENGSTQIKISIEK